MGPQFTSEKMVVAPREVIFVVEGVTEVRHWRACANMPGAKAVLMGVEDRDMEELLWYGVASVVAAATEVAPP